MELILASSSPRRFELLSEAGFILRVVQPDEVETEGNLRDGSAIEEARRLALAKAQSVARKLRSKAIVLGADTVVSLDEQVMGKARDREHARQILRMLSGTTHKVITGLALVEVPAGRCLVEHDVSSLRMADLSAEQIEAYLDSGAWTQKARAYGIQEDDAFILKIEGSFSKVVGLPMELLERMLKELIATKLLREIKR